MCCAGLATLALAWQGTQAIFNETDTMGYILIAIALILLGIAMLRTPSFGKSFGGLSLVFGLAALVGLSLVSIDSTSIFPFVILLSVIFPLIFGWKLYKLSRAA